MLARIASAAVAALALSGCVTLDGDRLLPTDKQILGAGGFIRPGLPMKQARLAPGYTVTEEVLTADFGRLALTRVESDPAKPLIVHCGGNTFRQDVVGAGAVEQMVPFGDVWMFDYPGFGRSGGDPGRVAFDALNRALSKRIDAAFASGRTGDLVFWGHSFGGGPCARLAATVRMPSHIVLMATFRDYDTVARAHVKRRIGPLSPLIRTPLAPDVPDLDIVDALSAYKGAVIALAARDDRVVPYAVTVDLERRLRTAGRRTKLVTFPTADHSRFLQAPGFRVRVQAALAEMGVGRAADANLR